MNNLHIYLLGFAIIMLLGCGQEANFVKPDFSLTAESFGNEYFKNIEASKEKFDGKIVKLTGIVYEKHSPSFSSPSYRFELQGLGFGNSKYVNEQLYAFMIEEDQKQKAKAEEVQEGENITLQCEFFIARPTDVTYFKNCVFTD